MDPKSDEPQKLADHVETFDYANIRDSFFEELKLAAKGQPESLPFVRNTITTQSLVKSGEIFEVFVIGGTNTETATLRYNADSTISIIDYHMYPEVTKFDTADALLTFVDEHVDDIATNIGINFAFGLQPLHGKDGQMDGVIIGGDNKGHALEGLENIPVGSAVEDHFMRVHKRAVTVTVANDVVCLLAAIAGKDIDSDTLLAGIVGTGYNMAFFLDQNTIVNVQSSDFRGFKPTVTGRSIDLESANAGSQLFGKEVAANDLYEHYNKLAEQFHLSPGSITSSRELAEIAVAGSQDEGAVAKALFKRSASLVAAQFAGLYNFKDRPPKLTAIMQGGLFWGAPGYKEAFVEQLINLGVPAEAIVFETLERSGIIGIAKFITGSL